MFKITNALLFCLATMATQMPCCWTHLAWAMGSTNSFMAAYRLILPDAHVLTLTWTTFPLWNCWNPWHPLLIRLCKSALFKTWRSFLTSAHRLDIHLAMSTAIGALYIALLLDSLCWTQEGYLFVLTPPPRVTLFTGRLIKVAPSWEMQLNHVFWDSCPCCHI